MAENIDEETDELFGEGFSASRLYEAWFGVPYAPEQPPGPSQEDLDRFDEHRKLFANRSLRTIQP